MPQKVEFTLTVILMALAMRYLLLMFAHGSYYTKRWPRVVELLKVEHGGAMAMIFPFWFGGLIASPMWPTLGLVLIAGLPFLMVFTLWRARRLGVDLLSPPPPIEWEARDDEKGER